MEISQFLLIVAILLALVVVLFFVLVLRLIRLIGEIEKNISFAKKEILPRVASTLDEIQTAVKSVREKTESVDFAFFNSALKFANLLQGKLFPLVSGIISGFSFFKRIIDLLGRRSEKSCEM